MAEREEGKGGNGVNGKPYLLCNLLPRFRPVDLYGFSVSKMASLKRVFDLSIIAFCSFGLVHAVDPLVDLGYTKLRGVAQDDGTTRWLGVRYAAPPVGELRFAAPVDPPRTTDVVDAANVRTNGGDAKGSVVV